MENNILTMLVKPAYNNTEEIVAKIATTPTSPSPQDSSNSIQAGFRRRKNLLALQDLTSVNLLRLKAENPSWELKDVMAEIIKNYPPEMPTDILQQMTNHIFSEWEALEKIAA